MSSMPRELQNTVSKRKKRKTRKCLNEIRKRSIRTMRDDLSLHNENKVRNNSDAPSLVTSKRLTLNVLKKTIRSDIITRPILEEIKQQSCYAYNNLSSTRNLVTKNVKVTCLKCSDSDVSNNSMPLFMSDEASQHHNACQSSPLSTHLTQPQILASLCATTGSGSQTTEGGYEHELYDDLMLKVSSHLKNISKHLITEDVMESTKRKINNLFLKRFSKENVSQKKMFKFVNNSTRLDSSEDNMIVENPMSYIRLKQSQELVTSNGTDLSETSSIVPSPEAVLSPQAPYDLTEVCAQANLYNTPQYNFYPHKLN